MTIMKLRHNLFISEQYLNRFLSRFWVIFDPFLRNSGPFLNHFKQFWAIVEPFLRQFLGDIWAISEWYLSHKYPSKNCPKFVQTPSKIRPKSVQFPQFQARFLLSLISFSPFLCKIQSFLSIFSYLSGYVPIRAKPIFIMKSKQVAHVDKSFRKSSWKWLRIILQQYGAIFTTWASYFPKILRSRSSSRNVHTWNP